ncbi:MAG: PASTA domain-containing protein [Candidatus Aminicenantes bacterium]|nr:PASTA domain-containing protein [Candidatus Aminicenantes bacterium]
MGNEEKKDGDSQGESNSKKGTNDKKARDQITGKEYDLRKEEAPDTLAAWLSIIYLLIMACFFLWQLFDLWIKNFTLIKYLGYNPVGLDISYNFHIVCYTFLGGALGSIVNEIRSFKYWHCELNGFGRRFIWKALSSPWLGGIVALIVFALIRAGVTVLGGDFSGGDNGDKNINQMLSMFALGAISGFGSHKVLLWLDDLVNKRFNIQPKVSEDKVDEDKVEVPDLTGKTKEEAEKILSECGLKLGQSKEKSDKGQASPGKISEQVPSPKTPVSKGSKIDVSIGAKPKDE